MLTHRNGPDPIDERTSTFLDCVAFGPLSIAFDADVLRPRAWTVLQSDWAAELLPRLPNGRILELCAGAGQIGLLAAYQSNRRLLQVDVSPAAARLARRNASAAGLTPRVEVREGDIESAVGSERFPLVMADPPYLRRDELSQFPEDPPVAVDGGADGLDLVARVLGVAGRVLATDGACLVQVRDLDQARTVCNWSTEQSGGLSVTDVRSVDEGAVVRLDRIAHRG